MKHLLLASLAVSLSAMETQTPKIHLETERLILREWDIKKDAPLFAALTEEYASMPPATLEMSQEIITELQNNIKQGTHGPFAIVLKNTKEFIGIIGSSGPPGTPNRPDNEGAIIISKKYMRKGYATEAAVALLSQLFTYHNRTTIRANINYKDIGVQKFAESLGMIQDPSNPPLRLEILYTISREQWQKRIRAPKVHLETERLILREWDIEKDAPYELSMKQNDPLQLQEKPLDIAQVKQSMAERQEHFRKYGYGNYALQLKETGELIGYGGLRVSPFTSGPLMNCIEAGAHLYPPYINKGYGTEVAKALMIYGFNQLKFEKIVACVHEKNTISKHLIEKMGLIRTVDSFAHPVLPPDHPLSICQLYAITQEQWLNKN